MDIETLYETIINPTYTLMPGKMEGDKASLMLCAIAKHESGLGNRVQIRGPARGLWQFESSGVHGVLSHDASKDHAKNLCESLVYDFNTSIVHDAIRHNDLLACGIARLLLWTDPKSLPDVGDKDGAYDLYNRTWRPGAKDEDRFMDAYEEALELFE